MTQRMRFEILLALLLLACSAQAQISSVKTIFIILMENHNWSQIKGNSSAPYINNTLLPMASHAEQYFNPPGIHPSLPNYLWLEAGDNFGILNDDGPDVNHQATPDHDLPLDLLFLPAAAAKDQSTQEGERGERDRNRHEHAPR